MDSQATNHANPIAIVGADGQLGQHLCKLLGGIAIGLGHSALDISDRTRVRSTMQRIRPRLIINAAAYTNVDRAETEPEKCRSINVEGVANLASACRNIACPFVHLSTDYVFGGDALRTQPYREDAPPQPVNVYGRSKLEGEIAAQEWPKTLIIRTCGLYGPISRTGRASNFAEAMASLSTRRDTVRVVDDQECTPTYIPHLSTAIFKLVDAQQYGIYHITNSGSCTWCDFAVEIFKLLQSDTKVRRVSSVAYGASALRPRYSVLDNRKYETQIGAAMPTWRDALREWRQTRSGNA